jgi:uncharacterized lipoprotein YajG
MFPFKKFLLAALVSSSLAACSNSPTTAGVQTSALTADQVAVLEGSAAPNVVRDAVDGGKVAVVRDTDKAAVHL